MRARGIVGVTRGGSNCMPAGDRRDSEALRAWGGRTIMIQAKNIIGNALSSANVPRYSAGCVLRTANCQTLDKVDDVVWPESYL